MAESFFFWVRSGNSAAAKELDKVTLWVDGEDGNFEPYGLFGQHLGQPGLPTPGRADNRDMSRYAATGIATSRRPTIVVPI